ncbi:MAG: histone deacetylase [Actinomycetia bacterium]|nr:histone deacetylase [Actinomycetes bacterium]
MTADGRVLYASTATIDGHDTASWHPERAARLPAVDRAIAEAGMAEVLVPLETRQASYEELAGAHQAHYLDALRRFVEAGGGELDPDTHASPGSWTTALWATGAGLAAVEAIDRGEASRAFVTIRPPGHHATADQAMGFCLINNVAVVASQLASRGERVFILDWDVHHGNGTQDIFWNDPNVLYASTHQHPAYPGTGRGTETGGPAAPGLIVNVPLPEGATGDAALAAYDQVIEPVVEQFDPTWTLISAGFDAHRDDPLAGLAWSAGDYVELTNRLQGRGPLLALLEGGYDLDALGRSAVATIAALAGADHRPELATSGGTGQHAVKAVADMRTRALEKEPDQS